jgi:uncharacterized membrane protein YkoI
MNKLLQLITLAVAVSSLAISSAPAQTKKAEANQSAQAKISKADAERLALQRNPGATVVNTTEATVNGHQVWALSVVTTGGNVTRKVYVDQETGKLSY